MWGGKGKGPIFLLGGSAALEAANPEFVRAAGGHDARIVLLLGGGKGWRKYVPQYVEPWLHLGIGSYRVIAPDEDGSLDLRETTAALRWATGIFIGGGHTPTYHRLYASEPLRGLIRGRCREGVPIVGLSAGALIIPEACVLPGEAGGSSPEIVGGLGLLGGIVVKVHFSGWQDIPALLKAMAEAGVRTGWGLGESACAVFGEEGFVAALGGTVYEISLVDPKTGRYKITTHSPLSPAASSG